jgi:hypothetical protein
MTVREIDEALAAWKSRLEAAAQNLMDLQAEPTYRRLTGCTGASHPPTTGTTAARLEPALGEFVHLFECLELLRATIDRAASLRDDLPMFGAEQKLHGIEDLLCCASIRLPAVDVPLEQRSLLDGAQNEARISPAALLDAMGKSFQSAKDAVIAVAKAWSDLEPALDRTAARIAALRAKSLSAAQIAELDSADRKLSELRAEVKADPLGATAGLDSQIRPILDGLESAVSAREQLHREIELGLAAAHAKFEELVRGHRDAVDATSRARLKIAGSLPAPTGDEKLAELRDWLERLKNKCSDGMVEPLTVGLRNWNMAAHAAIAPDHAALAASRAAIESRNELRGRLDALKAKARAYGVAEDHKLADLARQAEALLYTRPVSLERAGEAVAIYEKTLGAHAR